MKVKVLCPFYKICKNAGKECWRCRWNIALDIDDYLDTDEFEIMSDEDEG